jgi:hypothetical protein
MIWVGVAVIGSIPQRLYYLLDTFCGLITIETLWVNTRRDARTATTKFLLYATFVSSRRAAFPVGVRLLSKHPTSQSSELPRVKVATVAAATAEAAADDAATAATTTAGRPYGHLAPGAFRSNYIAGYKPWLVCLDA